MGFNIHLLNSCFCCSLKTGVIIYGILQLSFYILYFVDLLTYRIRYSLENENAKYLNLVSDIIFEYTQGIQLVCSCVLIYGAIKEKKEFITTWLLAELARIIDLIWNMTWITVLYFHWGYFIEELIAMGIWMTGLWIVYSFYNTMPKSKYIF